MKLALKSSAYRPDIDGLRALSIIAVLGYHGFTSLLPGGFVGVDVFFVISGYLITGLILSELQQKRFSFKLFYVRRIRRIFPALTIVLAAVYVAAWNILFPDEFTQLGKHIAGAAAFVSNIILRNEVGYFDTEASTKPLLHLWSLGIEEQFYLVWPLFTWLQWRWSRGRVAATLILLVASLGFSIYFCSAPAAFYSPLARLWELATGALIAQVQWSREGPMSLERQLGFWFPEWNWPLLRNGSGLVGVSLIFVAAYITPLKGFPGWWPLIPVGGSALVICAGPTAWINKNILSRFALPFIGTISYPLYLWHWPLISFAGIIYARTPPVEVVCGLLAVSFVLAWLTFVLIEQPIRHGHRPDLAAAGLITAIVAVGFVGLWTTYAGGLVNRSVAQANQQLAEDLAVPTTSRTSDGSCKKYFGIDLDGEEVCLASSDQPRLLVVGDSHSMAMYSAIHAGLVHEDAALLATHSHHWAEPECLKSEPFDAWLQGRSACQDVVRNVLNLLARQPSIAAVVIVTTPFNPFFLDREKIDTLQSAILSQGRPIVYLNPVPILAAPARCWPRKLTFWGLALTVDAPADACRMARSTIVKGASDWKRHIDSMMSKGKDVYVYDPTPLFCDAEYCYQSDSQGVLYWLLGHVNVRGSARLLKGLLPWMRAQGLVDR